MIDWTALSSQLTTPVQVTDVNLWLQQCVKPFDYVSRSDVSASLGAVSNYELFEQSSGLCMQSASCAFTNCTSGPFRDAYEPFAPLGNLAFYQSVQLDPNGVFPVLTDEEITMAASLSEDSQLPAAVVHPEHPGDVSAAVRFAADNGLKVSVKTSGKCMHSVGLHSCLVMAWLWLIAPCITEWYIFIRFSCNAHTYVHIVSLPYMYLK